MELSQRKESYDEVFKCHQIQIRMEVPVLKRKERESGPCLTFRNGTFCVLKGISKTTFQHKYTHIVGNFPLINMGSSYIFLLKCILPHEI